MIKVLVWGVIIFAPLSIILATFFFRIYYKEDKKMNQEENYMYIDWLNEPKEDDFQPDRDELWIEEHECDCPVCGAYSYYDDGDVIHCYECQARYIYDGKEWQSVK